MSYMVPLKTALTTAFKRVFDAEYTVEQFRNIRVSMEYPVEPQHYPGLWVDYDDTGSLVNAGVAHSEVEVSGSTTSRYLRWKFSGYLSVTVAALTSLERDRLYDEVVKVVAFGRQSPTARQFRAFIEDNDLIAVNLDFDTIEPRGNAVVPGTPWGSDEIIYERSLNIQVIGEFVSDSETGDLVPLSLVVIEVEELLPGQEPTVPDPEDGWQ
jgi:hypothetical protein